VRRLPIDLDFETFLVLRKHGDRAKVKCGDSVGTTQTAVQSRFFFACIHTASKVINRVFSTYASR
jgi:hypothetical protein